MARLPTPGGDNGTWGIILNDFLDVSFSATGELNANSVGTSQISDGAVTVAKISGAGTGNSIATCDANSAPGAITTSYPSSATLGRATGLGKAASEDECAYVAIAHESRVAGASGTASWVINGDCYKPVTQSIQIASA